MSIAKQVFEWLDNYPYIKWGLKNNLINFSSLSRKIKDELKVKNFDAVLISIRRYKENLKFVEDSKIKEILKEVSLEIRTRVNVYITKNIDFDLLKNLGKFHLISSKDWNMLISDKKLKLDAIKSHEDVIELSIKSQQDIEKCPGFMAFICSAIAEAGINIIEIYSVWTENMFIFDKKDLAKVVSCLEKIGIK